MKLTKKREPRDKSQETRRKDETIKGGKDKKRTDNRQQTPKKSALYPNPASTACFVQLAPTNTLLDIRIFNTHGQLVKTAKTSNINIADLPSGTHFMHLRSAAGEAIQELIVN